MSRALTRPNSATRRLSSGGSIYEEINNNIKSIKRQLNALNVNIFCLRSVSRCTTTRDHSTSHLRPHHPSSAHTQKALFITANIVVDFFYSRQTQEYFTTLTIQERGSQKSLARRGWPKEKVCTIIYANVEINQIIAI